MIYFIKIVDRETQQPLGIKIGKTVNLEARLKSHRQNNPGNILEVLTTMEGYTTEERALHKKFYKYRIGLGGCETFSYCEEIIHYINSLSVLTETFKTPLKLSAREKVINGVISELLRK